MTISVLYEDDYILAVDKPAGIIVHGDGTARATLTQEVQAYLEKTSQPKAALEAQALQRLDADTTGITLFSKSKESQPQFDALIASRDSITKTYLAVVRGAFPDAKQLIELPLGKDRHNAQRMCVSKAGKYACSEVSLIAKNKAGKKSYSLVCVHIHTGRKHQIRVHLSARGYPIVGDALYGIPTDRTTRSGTPRRPLMLHAYKEAFTHPITGEDTEIFAPYPERFDEFVDQPSSLLI